MNEKKIHLPEINKTINVANSKDSLLDLLAKEEIIIYSPCGGKGTCGKCKIRVKGSVNDITNEEKNFLTEDELENDIRLACRTFITGYADVYLLEGKLRNDSKSSLETLKEYKVNNKVIKKYIKIHKPTLENNNSVVECINNSLKDVHIDLDMLRKISKDIDYSKNVTITLYDNELIDMEYEDTRDKNYGVAIDIGTTTVACYLMDLNNGKQIKVSSTQNPQAVYGADVISRINYCLENEEGVEVLSKKVKKGIDELIKELSVKANIDKRHIYQCVLVGNTTMNHLFIGLNPKSLSAMPFNPVIKDVVIEKASRIGINSINSHGKIVFLSNIGGFVGSDTVGAIISADLTHDVDNSLIIDLGTNGEIVLSTPKGRYACSTAAGPAFEGAKIKNGMQAFSGAINSVIIEDDMHYTTIDNQPAKGICGSGLIDIISEFIRIGIITEDGKIVEPHVLNNEKLSKRIIKNGRKKEVIIAYDNETYNRQIITITQKDVRELQLAKGAIKAGINILLKVAEVKFQNIDRILLAGAFGNYINKESARRIGVFPNVELDKIISLGNAAGEGAKLALCNKEILDISRREYSLATKHIEISTHPDFQDEFVSGMYFK
ncbi:ASKHA domain-containing protein [Maledivibacter halophilus]|uniref:Uncharacterized 2Fe-2 and 4Fe-4S clusters-containing protein, contains DUF4445 domain n=1 Tax=Maledivibacter halophilus TaxID=36842 RepID=A0A1T5IKX0_9FIRM|nr:ASKHA domain-containing protein [Maledivibacter halophilus]SKC39633.1 Uncharacterized 2Fe-2 and 4Fe-4S clusters-containing protein, contains DUF4445 domain [Maledivibacter halophilus]